MPHFSKSLRPISDEEATRIIDAYEQGIQVPSDGASAADISQEKSQRKCVAYIMDKLEERARETSNVLFQSGAGI
ncbi:hypothetical protein CMI42_05480 [Candidatus Pacearchaeota archaeon]|nr:hypothetical protein [Candidatus Pacearchaeota archaeon]|tara:strand:- start:467 stop:691 length:225 start_codon:yes stop_codon:yes gene_type:complete